MRCNLDKEINNCPFYINGLCKNDNKCSFQESDKVIVQKYQREERWYEKYYKHSRRKI